MIAHARTNLVAFKWYVRNIIGEDFAKNIKQGNYNKFRKYTMI